MIDEVGRLNAIKDHGFTAEFLDSAFTAGDSFRFEGVKVRILECEQSAEDDVDGVDGLAYNKHYRLDSGGILVVKIDFKEETQLPETVTEQDIAIQHKEELSSLFPGVAKLYKAKQEALLNAGFTQHEALEILKARGIDL